MFLKSLKLKDLLMNMISRQNVYLSVAFSRARACLRYLPIARSDHVSVNLHLTSSLFFFRKNTEDICFESFSRKKRSQSSGKRDI